MREGPGELVGIGYTCVEGDGPADAVSLVSSPQGHLGGQYVQGRVPGVVDVADVLFAEQCQRLRAPHADDREPVLAQPPFSDRVREVRVKPHAGAEVHVVLDNWSTHTTPEVTAWLERNPHVHFHFTPVGSSWINQIETWFGIITRQSIRRGTFTSVTVLIKQIRDYIDHWNADSKPFVWTATADDILAKVQLVQTNIKKLVDNNGK